MIGPWPNHQKYGSHKELSQEQGVKPTTRDLLWGRSRVKQNIEPETIPTATVSSCVESVSPSLTIRICTTSRYAPQATAGRCHVNGKPSDNGLILASYSLECSRLFTQLKMSDNEMVDHSSDHFLTQAAGRGAADQLELDMAISSISNQF